MLLTTACRTLLHAKTVLVSCQVIEAGANALVAGSAVFGASDYSEGKHDTYSNYMCQTVSLWCYCMFMHGQAELIHSVARFAC